jgi:serine/threonine protein kinase
MLETPTELLQQLETCGLLSASIAELRDSLLEFPSAQEAADDLVRLKLLTTFQADVTLNGKAIPLVIGDYVVDEMLGRGGMGYVLKARHRRMKRPVAIKFLLKSLTESSDFQKRFEREVEAAAQLDHQNIVTAYDAGIHDGNHYLVMQFVDGDDLSHIVKTRGPLSISVAVDVVRQAAEGLDCAHDLGIIHRDIKPSNLLTDKKGVVRVLDLGLARIQRSPGDAVGSTGHADLTGTGSVLGTIDYMAPEQALDAKKADHLADIYSLGCTLYFLLTGNPPFGNETIMRRLLAHRQSEIPQLSQVRPEASNQLQQVFEMMMAKKRKDRHPSMKHLIVALDSLDLADSEADQIATLDMPERISGVGAESFEQRPDLHELPQAAKTRKAVSTAAKRGRRSSRGRNSDDRQPRAKRAAQGHSTKKSDSSSTSDTASVTREETIAENWRRRVTALVKEKLETKSHRKQLVAAVIFVFTLALACVIDFSGDPASESQPGTARNLSIQEGTNSDPVTESSNARQEPQSRIVELFNGLSLDGWETEGGSDWTVQDGMIKGSGNSLLVYTKEVFTDASVTVECRVPAESNSGLFLRHKFGDGWDSGYEAQISSDRFQETMTGGIYGVQNVKEQLIPHNEWFRLEFEAVGDRLKVRVNDRTTVDTVSGKFSFGHVALQSVGTAYFRRVTVQTLSQSSTNNRETTEDWTSLFNGRDLAGWQNVGDSNWTARDDTLHAEAGPRGWLATTQSFTDYEFECEFRMTYGANSGIFIHADPSVKSASDGLAEIQLLDSTNPQFSQINAKSSHGSLWNNTAPHIPTACLGFGTA